MKNADENNHLDDELAARYIGDNVKAIQEFRIKYIETNAELIESLKAAIATNDNKVIFHVTHKLKSSAIFIGAQKLHMLCKDAEKLCKQESYKNESANNIYNEIINEFKHIASIIQTNTL